MTFSHPRHFIIDDCVDTQQTDTYICAVDDKKLLIIRSRQSIFSSENKNESDHFLLSTTAFSQLLINNFDDTQQNFALF